MVHLVVNEKQWKENYLLKLRMSSLALQFVPIAYMNKRPRSRLGPHQLVVFGHITIKYLIYPQ